MISSIPVRKQQTDHDDGDSNVQWGSGDCLVDEFHASE